MLSKTLPILFFISILISGCYSDAEITNDDINPNIVCDKYGYEYETESRAREAGLSDSGFSTSYCAKGKNIHYTWDMNEDGINDCESDGACDHTQDYSTPRYEILGVEDGIVFDDRSGKWVDKVGICHSCTPENGFENDGLKSNK